MNILYGVEILHFPIRRAIHRKFQKIRARVKTASEITALGNQYIRMDMYIYRRTSESTYNNDTCIYIYIYMWFGKTSVLRNIVVVTTRTARIKYVSSSLIDVY